VGLDAREYFNSGVLLLDLELMRRDGCMEAVREFALENRDRLIWPDQDALNVVLGRRRLALHPRWNSMNSLDFYRERSEKVFGPQPLREARERPGIRHFEGPWINKPWHILCERANRELYAGHRRATPWPRYRRTGLTPANLLRWPGVERRRRAQARVST
jgi:lipopolysaccharide biosynthesis glycosyltransferase